MLTYAVLARLLLSTLLELLLLLCCLCDDLTVVTKIVTIWDPCAHDVSCSKQVIAFYTAADTVGIQGSLMFFYTHVEDSAPAFSAMKLVSI